MARSHMKASCQKASRLKRRYSLRSPFGPACGCYFARLGSYSNKPWLAEAENHTLLWQMAYKRCSKSRLMPPCWFP